MPAALATPSLRAFYDAYLARYRESVRADPRYRGACRKFAADPRGFDAATAAFAREMLAHVAGAARQADFAGYVANNPAIAAAGAALGLGSTTALKAYWRAQTPDALAALARAEDTHP